MRLGARLTAPASAALLLATSCGGTTTPSARAAEARPPAPTRAALRLVAECRHARCEERTLVVGELDGARAFAIGGARVLVGPDRVRRARDLLVRDIVAAQPRGAGWILMDEAGDLFEADDWLGDLTPIGSLGRPVRRSASRGAVALIDALDGGLWLGDDLRHLERAWPAALGEASFVDARHGWIEVAHAWMFFTEDGGATWSPLELDGWTPLPGAGTDGWWLWRDGGIGGHLDRSGVIERSRAPATTREAVLAHLPRADELRAVHATAEARAGDPFGPRVAGRAVTDGAGGLRHADADGSITAVEDREPSVGACSLYAFDRGVGATCPDEGRWTLLHSRDGTQFARIAEHEEPPDRLDPDGPWLAWDRRDALRVAERDGAPRPLVIEGVERPQLEALRGGLAAGQGWRDDRPVVFWAELPAGRSRALELPEGMEAPRLSITDDGDLLLTTTREDFGAAGPRVVLHRVERPATTVRVEVPDGATAASFVDRRRGLAVGDSLDQVWRTLDGGASWREVAVAEGAVEEVSFRGASVTCRGERCVVESRGVRFSIEGWGLPEAPAARFVRGPSPSPPPAPRGVPETMPLDAFGALGCRPSGDAPARTPAEEPPRVRARPVGARWRLEWSGGGPRPYRERSAPFDSPFNGRPFSVSPLVVERDVVVALLCAGHRCATARASGDVPAEIDEEIGDPVGAAAVGDGDVVIIEGRNAAYPHGLHRVSWTRDGERRTREAVFPAPLAIGAVDGSPTVALPVAWATHGDVAAGAAWLLVPLDGSATRAIAQTEPLRVCDGDAGSAHLSLTTRGQDEVGETRRVLGVGASGLCIRAASLPAPVEGADGSVALVRMNAVDGALRGILPDGRTIACAVDDGWLGGEPPTPDEY